MIRRAQATSVDDGPNASLAASMLSYNLHLNLWVGALLALCISLAVGFFNGYMVMRTKIPSFLITLASFLMLTGINLAVTKLVAGQVATPSVSDMQGFDSGKAVFASSISLGPVSLRITVLWWILFTIVATYVLFKTRVGNWIFAVGGDLVVTRVQQLRRAPGPQGVAAGMLDEQVLVRVKAGHPKAAIRGKSGSGAQITLGPMAHRLSLCQGEVGKQGGHKAAQQKSAEFQGGQCWHGALSGQ